MFVTNQIDLFWILLLFSKIWRTKQDVSIIPFCCKGVDVYTCKKWGERTSVFALRTQWKIFMKMVTLKNNTTEKYFVKNVTYHSRNKEMKE